MYPGELITPTLRLVEQLGAGGMGSVWIADHLALQSRVAVKFMARELASDPDVRNRFAREAIAASHVKSPHVVQTFDHGTTSENVPFIVMELLDGDDLARWVRRRGRPSPADVATILSQACKALGRAHDAGIVHRDIKPENVFLCETGDDDLFVKVLDFGIAKVADGVTSSTRTGAVMGTAYYMSPEQIVGARTVDHRTDLWALGVLVYELLTGVRPFDGETIGALTLAIHGSTPRPPSSLVPALGPGVDAWFARACARDPAARFQSAREMAKALSAALGEPVRVGTDPSHVPATAAWSAEGSAPGMPAALAPSSPGRDSGLDPRFGIGSGVASNIGGNVGSSVGHAAQDAPRPLTTTAGQTSAATTVLPRSRAPLAIALVVLLAIVGGIGAFVLTRGDSSAPPAAAASTEPAPGPKGDDDEPPAAPHPKHPATIAPPPRPDVAVSSAPTPVLPPASSSAKRPNGKTAPPMPSTTALTPTPTSGPTLKPTTTSTGPSEPPLF